MISYIIAINIVLLLLFGIDKQCVVCGWRRVPERLLLAMSLAGGSVGALAGMWLFRHKTKKVHFRVAIPAMLLLHLILLYCFGSNLFFSSPVLAVK